MIDKITQIDFYLRESCPENSQNVERNERFIHKFENIWILTETIELRSINNQK